MGKHTVVCGANRAIGSTAAKLTAEQHSSTTAAASAGGDTAFVSAVIMMGPIPVFVRGEQEPCSVGAMFKNGFTGTECALNGPE